MERSSISIVYNKYLKKTNSSETFKNKFSIATTQNHILNTKVKDLEVENEQLKDMLGSIENDL